MEALGTRVPFSDLSSSLIVLIEQFWGRAARAAWIRKNPDACLIFRHLPKLIVRSYSPGSRRGLTLVGGDSEIHRDARLRFHGLPALVVGFKSPLLHSFASRGGQDAWTADDLEFLNRPFS